ncbi:Dph6-related ATP pyrophosphatase [Larkinella soli]|uniref:Dph6-related ATP pyrophosphatase n=1 Tax=Larkinella soli TaxID=1770527 RepID=UPI000FFB27D6|nr:diphthine--ammonia ligase [Larkinella soli]
MNRKKAIVSWSGGKDSALALFYAQQNPELEIVGLMTSVNERFGRVSMHGVRTKLIQAQADALRLPLQFVRFSGEVSLEIYNATMQKTFAALRDEGISRVVYGDIFLEDLKQYRERQLERAGLQGVFPLWKKDSGNIMEEFLALGFRTVLVCLNENHLPEPWAGRELDLSAVQELPASVDPCGENGEYHTFVFDGPTFSRPVKFIKGEVIRRTYEPSGSTDCHADTEARQRWDTGFIFQDLIPNVD